MFQLKRPNLIFAASLTAVALLIGCNADTGDLATLSVEAAVARQARGDVLVRALEQNDKKKT